MLTPTEIISLMMSTLERGKSVARRFREGVILVKREIALL